VQGRESKKAKAKTKTRKRLLSIRLIACLFTFAFCLLPFAFKIFSKLNLHKRRDNF
jgi:hypothetical protein